MDERPKEISTLVKRGAGEDVDYESMSSTSTLTVDLADLESNGAVKNFHVNPSFTGNHEGRHDTDVHQGNPWNRRKKIRLQLQLLCTVQDVQRLTDVYIGVRVNWFEEVASTSRANHDIGVYHYVLATLREYPLTIREKTLLSGKIRARLDATSLASISSRLSVTKQDKRSNKRSRHNRPTSSWSSGLTVPFGLWESNIGRIAAFFGSHVASYFQFLRFLVLMNTSMALIMFLFVSLPQIVPGKVWSDDVLEGFFGDLSHTIFFYGAYHNTSILTTDVSYNIPLAYLMTWSTGQVLAILMIVSSMYVRYRQIKKADDTGEEPFSNHTFLGWDYSVTNHAGSKLRSIAIATNMKEMLREEKAARQLTLRERLKLWCIRIVCSLASVAVLAASAYLIYVVADESIKPSLNLPLVTDEFLKDYLLSLLIMGLKVLIPPLLSLLLLLERYHPRTQIKVQIARTAVFYVASLVVYLASIYSISTQCLTLSTTNTTSGCCWENTVGEQLFQVVILDLAITLIVGLGFTGGRAVLVKCCNYQRFGYKNFNVVELILDLVYGQSLIWLGLFFAPFLALVGVLKLCVVFYFNYVLAKTSCVPPTKIFRASRSGTFFLFVLLVTLFVCLFPLTYALIELEPSKLCGPFKDDYHFYEALTNKIGESPSWIRDILSYTSTPAVIIPVLIVLLLIILYYRAKSTVHKMEAKELRYRLQFERKVEKRRIFARAKLEHGISVMSGLDT